jgi:hypothetical protein
MGPPKTVKAVLGRAEKVEVVVAAPNYDPAKNTGGLDGSMRLGQVKEDMEVIKKCLAICMVYIAGRKIGKSAGRDLNKQLKKREKGKFEAALRTGEVTERRGRGC